MTAPAPVQTTATFTAADRCDRCSAQAFVRVVLRTGDLLFCGHQARANEQALRPFALRVEDGTEALVARPSASAY